MTQLLVSFLKYEILGPVTFLYTLNTGLERP